MIRRDLLQLKSQALSSMTARLIDLSAETTKESSSINTIKQRNGFPLNGDPLLILSRLQTILDTQDFAVLSKTVANSSELLQKLGGSATVIITSLNDLSASFKAHVATNDSVILGYSYRFSELSMNSKSISRDLQSLPHALREIHIM